MSLTNFISLPEIRERFNQEFTKPRIGVNKEIIAPPLSTRYGLIGTAFDYLLRFYIQKHNPNAISGKWIAEISLDHLISIQKEFKDTGKSTKYISKDIQKAQEIICRSKIIYEDFLSLKTVSISNTLLQSTLLLAQLDIFYRSGIINPDFGETYEEDIADLKKLIDIVDLKLFEVKQKCLLNPTFGEAALSIGGADADLLIDDMIIDIKTTKKFQFLRQDFNQLLGYYILHEIDGISLLTPKPKVTKVAIYFSRFAYLHIIDLGQVVNTGTFPTFIEWFISKVREHNDRAHNEKEIARQAKIEYEKSQEEKLQRFIKRKQEHRLLRSKRSNT